MSAIWRALASAHSRFASPDAGDTGELQCHEMVELARRLPEARGMRTIRWDESKWADVSRILTEDKEAGRWPTFTSTSPRELLVDVADGSVNGHSFFVGRRGRITDPYMEARGVPASDIQRLGRYLLDVYRRA